jgi:M6 family metalloprotease-like protein
MSITHRTFPILTAALLALTAAILITTSGLAAPMVGVPVQVTQPDGTPLDCFASGDEFYNWMHDANGYTILQDHSTGWYVYADLLDGELIPTEYVPGRVDPAEAGLAPYLKPPAEKIEELVGPARSAVIEKMGATSAPTIGTITNAMVFIRFSDESEFTGTTASYETMLNSTYSGVNSLRNYYTEVSYNQLTVSSYLYPTPPGSTVVSYQDSHPRAYYQPYDATTNPTGYLESQRGPREHTLLRDAINYVKALGQLPAGTILDADNDGYVDSLTFVVNGSPTGWNSLLWPHAWALFSYDVRIDGKQLYRYNLQMGSITDTGILAHEFFHILGGPDLYHYSFDGLHPVGGYDVMAGTGNPPQHMGCYMKYRYGHWIPSLPLLTTSGSYTLNPLTSATNNCVKIASPNSTTQFFILEYRRPGTSIFEASLYTTGLLVYRVNSTLAGNAGGPPDELYIYRPNGTPTANGNLYEATFSANTGRTIINNTTNPSSFLADGSAGGLDLCSIGSAGTSIAFTLGNCAWVNPPSSFAKISPVSTIVTQTNNLILDWSDPGDASYYEYCLDGTINGSCNGSWIYTGSASQATVGGLAWNRNYEWQVRATNAKGTTLANSGSYGTFSTMNPVMAEFIYFPLIKKPGTPPAAFGKVTPTNTSVGVSTSTTLDWTDASGAVFYEYCYDVNVDGSCSGAWTSTGTTSQVSLSGLAGSTTHEWQVRAVSGDFVTYADSDTPWSFTTLAAVAPWTIITSEDFEGTFPQSGWSREDHSTTDGGEYLIGKRICNVNTGSYSGWLVGGGAQGDTLGCGANYVRYNDSWFIYGPFSTIGAAAAQLNYNFYLKSAANPPLYDQFRVMASDDNTNYRGISAAGSFAWRSGTLDLSQSFCGNGTTNCLGKTNVWIAFNFNSVVPVPIEYGAIIDNIILRKCNAVTCTGAPPLLDPLQPGDDAANGFLQPFLQQFTGYGSLILPH